MAHELLVGGEDKRVRGDSLVGKFSEAWHPPPYMLAEIQAKLKLFLSSVCDLVHVQSVIDLFARQLNNALSLP